jgi:pseudouridine-5'-phosphate glycosidase
VFTVHPEVADALAAGRGVVALESTILAHGLPRPDNRRIADDIQAAVRSTGAVPATVAVLDGRVHIGLGESDLDRLCEDTSISKLSVRDVGVAVALDSSGATTVASTSALAHRAGIAVFATGGLGGVHRGASSTFDVSADLGTIARTPVLVVCAGVKSILDVPATLEYLETLSVPVIGYRTHAFPGFYLSDSGLRLSWRVDEPAQAAAVVAARRVLATDSAGVVLANPLPPDRQLDPVVHDRVLAEGLAMLERDGVTGKDVTPRLLAHFHEATAGESLRANIELVLANARLAGQVAVALSELSEPSGQPGPPGTAGRAESPGRAQSLGSAQSLGPAGSSESAASPGPAGSVATTPGTDPAATAVAGGIHGR